MSYNFEVLWLWWKNYCILLSGDKRTNSLHQRASPAMTNSSSHLFNKYLLVISYVSLIIWGTAAADPLGIGSAGSISEFSKRSRHINNKRMKIQILNTMTNAWGKGSFPSKQQGNICYSCTERCVAWFRYWRTEKSWLSWVSGKEASLCKEIERHQIRWCTQKTISSSLKGSMSM